MRRALGRGLSQLVAEQFDSPPADVAIEAIIPNSRQPRTHFDESALAELADSIGRFGVLQPLIVKPIGEDRYELIAGERRLRAAKLAGLKRVPIVIRAAGDQTSLELALIENIQREDINPMECARAYARLMNEFDLTQEQVAEKVGKSRTAVANAVRLLRLPKQIGEAIEQGRITEGHAKALLAFDSEAQQLAIFDQIIERGLTVREVEKVGKRTEMTPKPKSLVDTLDPDLAELQSGFGIYFGSPVKIQPSGIGGKITIDYYSTDDLGRIAELLGFGK